jgi:hypothetical protein
MEKSVKFADIIINLKKFVKMTNLHKNLDSFDENKVKCRDCKKYIEKDSASPFVDLDKNFNAIKDYYLCGICIGERMKNGVPIQPFEPPFLQ